MLELAILIGATLDIRKQIADRVELTDILIKRIGYPSDEYMIHKNSCPISGYLTSDYIDIREHSLVPLIIDAEADEIEIWKDLLPPSQLLIIDLESLDIERLAPSIGSHADAHIENMSSLSVRSLKRLAMKIENMIELFNAEYCDFEM